MNENLHSVTRTLRKLLLALPAIRQHRSASVVKQHMALIAHYQSKYDRLATRRPR